MFDLTRVFEALATKVQQPFAGHPEHLPGVFRKKTKLDKKRTAETIRLVISSITIGQWPLVTVGQTIGKRYVATPYRNPYVQLLSDMRFEMIDVDQVLT
jgi:hypothetical protein